MGRRVYEEVTGEFVWKYVFGGQDSEQGRIQSELGVGGYGIRHYQPEWYEGKWEQGSDEPCGDILCIHRDEIPKLEEWIKNAGDYKKADEEGIKLVHSFMDSQSEEFNKAFKEVREWKCLEDFEYYGSNRKEGSFETYKIWCKGFNNIIKHEPSFYLMVCAFVAFMRGEGREHIEIFRFSGEF